MAPNGPITPVERINDISSYRRSPMFDNISSVYPPPIFVEIRPAVQSGLTWRRFPETKETLRNACARQAPTSGDPLRGSTGATIPIESDDSRPRAKIEPAGIYLQLFRQPIGIEQRLRADCKYNFVVKSEPPGAIMESHFHRAGNRNFTDIQSVGINGTGHRVEKKEPRDCCFVLSDPASRYFLQSLAITTCQPSG